MRYRCVYTCQPITDGIKYRGMDHHLMVDATSVSGAIKALREQMKRQGDRLSSIIAICPEHMFKMG